jgi:hypothetical protein
MAAIQPAQDVLHELALLRHDLNQYHEVELHVREQRRDHEGDRGRVKQLIDATTKVDGASAPALRQWFREVEMTIPLTGGGALTIEIATRTITGSLRLETERWIVAQGQLQPPVLRNHIAWADLRAHLSETFLTRDEAAHMRTEVTEMRQTAFESEASYVRRFRDVAAMAYPAAGRNADQERLLLDAFLKGLKNTAISREIILHENAQGLEEAMVLVGRYSGAEERLRRLQLLNRETPMEVNASTEDTSKKMEDGAVTLQQIARNMERLTSKLAAMDCKIKGDSVASVGPSKKVKTKHARSRCGYCKREGHAEADCRTKARAQQQPRRPANNGACFNCGRRGHFARECRSAPSGRHPQRPAGYVPQQVTAPTQPNFYQQQQVTRPQGNGQWGPSYS